MSVRSLGSLTLDMVLKTGNFLGPMDQAQRRTKRTTTQMAAEFEKVANRVGALGVAAATAAAGGIAALTREGMNAIDSQAKLARSLEGTIDGLRAVNIAASDSGIDGMEASLNRMNRRLGAVEMSGGPALKTVQRLNLDLAALRDMDVDERVAHIADRIHDMGLSNQEAARHLQQLGFEQRAATQLFMDGGDAIRAARQEVDEYGLSVSMVDAAAIEAANDALSRSGRLVESTRNALAVELAPIVLAVANHFNDAAREVGGMQSAVQQGVDTSIIYLGTFLDAVWQIDNSIRTAGITTREFLLVVVRSMASAATAIVEGPVNALNNLIGTLNRIPGIDIDFANQPDLVYGMRDQVETLERAIRNARTELDELAAGAAPSEQLNAFIAQAREAAAALAVATGSSDDDKQDPEDPDSPSSSSARSAVDAIANQVAALERQAATLGMTQEAVRLFELAQDGATDSQLAAARAALEAISAYESQEEAAQAYQNLLLDLRTNEERLTDQMRERLAVLDAANVSAEEHARVSAMIIAASQPEQEAGYWEKWLAGAESALGDFDKLASNVAENFSSGFGRALEGIIFDLDDAGDAGRAMLEGLARSTVNALGQMAGQWLAYQAVQLAVGKTTQASAATTLTANAQAGVFQAGINAFSSTAAIPVVGPAMAPGAMAAAIGATQPLATAVSGAALAGMAHDGIDSVPKTGTWLLEKGERVTTADTSAKLDATLARVESQMNRPGDSMSAGGGMAGPVIHVDARGATDPAAVREQARRGAEEAYRMVAEDFANNGKLRRMLGA